MVTAEIGLEDYKFSWHLIDTISEQVVASESIASSGEKVELFLPRPAWLLYGELLLLEREGEVVAAGTMSLALVRENRI